jgi:hypothetical protein
MRNEQSALSDKIIELHKRGRLSVPFGVAEIPKHFGDQYSDNHIKTVLANYCEGTGDMVKRGHRARFQRVSKGKYSPLSN